MGVESDPYLVKCVSTIIYDSHVLQYLYNILHTCMTSLVDTQVMSVGDEQATGSGATHYTNDCTVSDPSACLHREGDTFISTSLLCRCTINARANRITWLILPSTDGPLEW